MNPRFKGLGFRRDLPDIRDLTFDSSGIIRKVRTLPKTVDLRGHRDMPPVYDQGSIGSCVAQSVGAICDFEHGQDKPYTPSTLFLYYVTRSLEGTVDVDCGATIRSGIKAANEFGVAKNRSWPYLEEKFRDTPPKPVFVEAQEYQALEYKRLRHSTDAFKQCLAGENLIAFGIAVYDGLYSITPQNPVLPMPNTKQQLLGGHAVVMVGYDDLRQHFIVRNSWGKEWGEKGYFYIPYKFMADAQLAMDFWSISLVEK